MRKESVCTQKRTDSDIEREPSIIYNKQHHNPNNVSGIKEAINFVVERC